MQAFIYLFALLHSTSYCVWMWIITITKRTTEKMNGANDLSVAHTEKTLSFVCSASSKVLPTQMCAYFNLNMLYHHQRNEIYIFMYIVVVDVDVFCVFYSTIPNVQFSADIKCHWFSLSFFLIRCAFLCCFAIPIAWFFHFLWLMISIVMRIFTHSFPPVFLTRTMKMAAQTSWKTNHLM